MEWLLPLHPRLVHFPIALSLIGVLFVILGRVRRHPVWSDYGRLSLILGWLGVLLATATGLIDQSAAPATPEVTTNLNQHITAGIALIVVLGLCLYWPIRYRNMWANPGQRRMYMVFLLLTVGLVLLEAWLGGKLVYQHGVGVAAPAAR